MRNRTNSKSVAVRLPLDVIERLRLESARRNESIQEIVTSALNHELPKSIRIVVGKDGERKRA